MTAEHLIEEAAKAMFYANMPPTMNRDQWDALWPEGDTRTAYTALSRAAWAVFEEARTPTKDEREALAKLIEDIDSGWLMGEARNPYPSEMAHELIRLGVGFRRSEVPLAPVAASPRCGCSCHTTPGVAHIAPCCYPEVPEPSPEGGRLGF